MKDFTFNSKDLYSSLFSGSIIPILLSDENDNIIDVNKSFCSLLGYSRQELLSMSLTDIIPDEKRKKGTSVIVFDVETYNGQPFESVDISKTGERIPVEIVVFPVRSNGRDLYFSIVKDIRKRKANERKLIQSEKQYRNVFENAGIPIWEEDFSTLIAELDRVKRTGVKDLRDYISRHPDYVESILPLIRVRNVNSKAIKVLGAETKEQVLGSLEKFFHPSQLGVIKEEIIALWEGKQEFVSELKYYSLQKVPLTLLLNVRFPEKKEDFKRVIVSFMDITRLKETELSLVHAIEEKKVLLKELYHRTKNNMQMIGSLLTLKASYTENRKVSKVFEEMKNRIHSMSLVHEKLYQSESLYSIHLNDYIEDIVDSLKSSYAATSAAVSVRTDLKEITVSIETAIPLGIVLNEILVNTFKYAFPGESGGEISISLLKTGKGIIKLLMSDNGTGLPDDFNPRASDSLGMKLIFSIVEEQLKGEISYFTKGGVNWELNFPG